MPLCSLSAKLASLPAEPAVAPHPAKAKVVVLDDDPTGTQTVHGIPVLTTWDIAELEAALREPGPCFFILTNTRAVPSEHACAITREIGVNLACAVRTTGQPIALISRSDSTLRGHYPAETDALTEGLGWSWDGTLIVPAFFAGGRITIDDVHYIAEGDVLTPVSETEFARDRSFGYTTSNLRDWVEEKMAGRVCASEVRSIPLADLRSAGVQAVTEKLLSLPSGGIAVVNAAAPGDLAVLTHALAEAEKLGKCYLFRTAADFVAAYAGISSRPLLPAAKLVTPGVATGGLLVVGSYVGKTSLQLEALFRSGIDLIKIEVSVARLLRDEARVVEIQRCVAVLEDVLASGQSVALFTSREIALGKDPEASLHIGKTVSSSLVNIVSAISTPPSWLIAKGGITSSDIATHALGIRRARILGQAMPGVPVWLTGQESKWPNLRYVIFPGNVGDVDSLAIMVQSLEGLRPVWEKKPSSASSLL